MPIFDFGAQLATTRSKLMKYKAEQARLFSTADDVNYEVLKIYQTIYTLTHNILGLQGDVAKAQRDVQVIQAQQQQGIGEPLIAIEKELHLIAKQDELEWDRSATPQQLRAPAESSRWRVEVDSMKQSQRIVKNAVFGIGASLIGGLVYLATRSRWPTLTSALPNSVNIPSFSRLPCSSSSSPMLVCREC